MLLLTSSNGRFELRSVNKQPVRQITGEYKHICHQGRHALQRVERRVACCLSLALRWAWKQQHHQQQQAQQRLRVVGVASAIGVGSGVWRVSDQTDQPLAAASRTLVNSKSFRQDLTIGSVLRHTSCKPAPPSHRLASSQGSAPVNSRVQRIRFEI